MVKGICGRSRRSRLEIIVREVSPREEACHFMRDEMQVGQGAFRVRGDCLSPADLPNPLSPFGLAC